jgi:hypothetical protein
MEETSMQKLTKSQAAVYGVLQQFGPVADCALVPLAQHQAQLRLSSSGIRSRRKELVDLKLVKQVSTIKTGTGRTAAVYEVV